MSEARSNCSHYTPTEDQSDYAYMHRTYGCPDNGIKWPVEAMKALPDRRTGKTTSRKCVVCQVEFEPKTPIMSRDRLLRHNLYHVGCWTKFNQNKDG